MSIKIEKLNYVYSYKKKYAHLALDEISFNIDSGLFVALIGKTGSGKSTLLQHLNGLLIPTSGKVEVCNYIIDVSKEYKKNGQLNEHLMNKKRKHKYKDINTLRKRVGFVSQFPEYQLFAESVIKDVSFGPLNFGYSIDESLEMSKKALNLLGIDSSFYNRNPFELSGGEKRKVALAGILSFNPDILVLDEPTVGLDYESKNNLIEIIKNLQKEKKTIIISTHDMDLVLECCDEVILLDNGKMISHLKTSEFFLSDFYFSSNDYVLPSVLSFARRLKEKGFKLDLKKLKDVNSLVSEINREIYG